MQYPLDKCALEDTYGERCRLLQAAYEHERTRRLKLHSLLLEDECEDLQDHLGETNDRVQDLETQIQELQEILENSTGLLETVQSDVRIKCHENETLKVGTVVMGSCY